ncbi:MAG TPA: hypothetical protein VK752_05415 [Bryobacteraceae bacterium]|jgi:hypothetical protein|nr:hypothetical protein [Bryobacteraceae bacterium]
MATKSLAGMLLLALPFDVHNGFWTNLHHFLLQQSIETTEGNSLPAAEKTTWTEAVHFYQVRFAGKDRLSREMEAIKNSIEDHDSDTTLAGVGLDADLRRALERAALVYRRQWWPEHSKANEAWIASEIPLIEKYGTTIIPRLAAAYATAWPAAPIRVDVAWYGSRVTAYTTLWPTRTVVSSGDPRNAGLDGLEILFHEASHGLTAKLQKTISDDARKEGKLLPQRDLWHALLFYTTGEIVAEAVAKDAPDHVPYATSQGLWERSWPGYPHIFEREWKPWLKGERDFDEAVRKVVDAVLAAPR